MRQSIDSFLIRVIVLLLLSYISLVSKCMNRNSSLALAHCGVVAVTWTIVLKSSIGLYIVCMEHGTFLLFLLFRFFFFSINSIVVVFLFYFIFFSSLHLCKYEYMILRHHMHTMVRLDRNTILRKVCCAEEKFERKC